jgi:hypothetical protein
VTYGGSAGKAPHWLEVSDRRHTSTALPQGKGPPYQCDRKPFSGYLTAL